MADDALQAMVQKLEAHAFLDDGDRDALLALPCSTRLFDPAAHIIREGDAPTVCGVLLSGFAHRQKLTADGARQIMSVHIPGDLLDVQHLSLDVADHSIQTLTRAEVAMVPRGPLREVASVRPNIAHALLVNALAEASIYREWLLNIGRRNARTRIAHLLCEFAVRMDAEGLCDGHAYELPMTQDQLADAVGLTPVHVNRTLKLLEREGLIERKAPHPIPVVGRAARRGGVQHPLPPSRAAAAHGAARNRLTLPERGDAKMRRSQRERLMPMYFFDVQDHGQEIDDSGFELSGPVEARKQALILAGAMLSDDPDLVWDGEEFQVKVRDKAGRAVLTVHISAVDETTGG